MRNTFASCDIVTRVIGSGEVFNIIKYHIKNNAGFTRCAKMQINEKMSPSWWCNFYLSFVVNLLKTITFTELSKAHFILKLFGEMETIFKLSSTFKHNLQLKSF